MREMHLLPKPLRKKKKKKFGNRTRKGRSQSPRKSPTENRERVPPSQARDEESREVGRRRGGAGETGSKRPLYQLFRRSKG